MPTKSAGILLHRRNAGRHEVLLVHPGGPFWQNKDNGVWSIPKGLIEDDEDPLTAARREFREETGFPADGEALPLTPCRQSGKKVVYAWAVEGSIDPSEIASNTFSLKWPPRSGRTQEFPEVDRAAWFTFAEAQNKILKGQLPLIVELADIVRVR
ncbi:MAG: NUDIX domain-containing protein [Sedimentisphaerales bacterium]|jgi:predicted NUDIX family NTP pyrophosphohydrolase|nr:NUDIX domain-containing protein [Sedimentisphaerales bacterium]NLT75001.1 NUDIX domain-containing protein [Planctomycetota bacterium]